MSGESGHRFLCPGCGASFGWKPQYAGRKIRCKCGQVFVPPDPATAAAVEEPDPYDLNDDLAKAASAAPVPVRRATLAAPPPMVHASTPGQSPAVEPVPSA